MKAHWWLTVCKKTGAVHYVGTTRKAARFFRHCFYADPCYPGWRGYWLYFDKVVKVVPAGPITPTVTSLPPWCKPHTITKA